jgi:RNA polymerase sigma-70 factor (ECF subfamily)
MMDADVKRALDSLPHDYKMVVLLADIEGFSYKEIAEILDCPVGTVMSRLYRGRKLLQKNLMSYAVEQGVLQAPRAMELGSEAEEEADVLEFKRRAGG